MKARFKNGFTGGGESDGMFTRFSIPTPFQVGPVNAYLAGRTLVDPGPGSEEAWAALLDALEERDLGPTDIEQVLRPWGASGTLPPTRCRRICGNGYRLENPLAANSDQTWSPARNPPALDTSPFRPQWQAEVSWFGN